MPVGQALAVIRKEGEEASIPAQPTAEPVAESGEPNRQLKWPWRPRQASAPLSAHRARRPPMAIAFGSRQSPASWQPSWAWTWPPSKATGPHGAISKSDVEAAAEAMKAAAAPPRLRSRRPRRRQPKQRSRQDRGQDGRQSGKEGRKKGGRRCLPAQHAQGHRRGHVPVQRRHSTLLSGNPRRHEFSAFMAGNGKCTAIDQGSGAARRIVDQGGGTGPGQSTRAQRFLDR